MLLTGCCIGSAGGAAGHKYPGASIQQRIEPGDSRWRVWSEGPALDVYISSADCVQVLQVLERPNPQLHDCWHAQIVVPVYAGHG